MTDGTVIDNPTQPNNPGPPTRAAAACPDTPNATTERTPNMTDTTVIDNPTQPNNPGQPCDSLLRSGAAAACPNTPSGSDSGGYDWLVDDHDALRGLELRRVLVNYIDQGTATIQGMIRRLAKDGHTVWGRASKVISDVLRTEIARKRVRRVRRGVYRPNTIPRTTLHRIRRTARALFFSDTAVANRRTINDIEDPRHLPPPDRHWRNHTKRRSI